MPDAITFSELRKIQKEESRQDELTERDDKFLLKVADYLETKKEVSGDSREYRNARRIFDKIIGLREDKIVKNAKLAVKSDLDATKLEMLPVEQELFRQLKKEFGEHRERIDERVENGADEVLDSGEEQEEIEEDEIEEDEDSSDAVKVRATSEIPEFMGTDLESYGPFDEGEEVEIPGENAEILLNRGSAERIE